MLKIFLKIVPLPLGILILIFRENLQEMFLKNYILDISPKNFLFYSWTEDSPQLEFNVYIFNWTNPDNFKDNFTTPKLTEIGPFKFKEIIDNVNVTYEENDTVSFFRNRKFYFDKENSTFDLDTEIIILNPLIPAVMHSVRNSSAFIKIGINPVFNTLGSEYIKASAKKLLFDGFDSFLLGVLKDYSGRNDEALKNNKNPTILLYKNDSAENSGYLNMGTGRSKKLGAIYKRDHSSKNNNYGKNCSSFLESALDYFVDAKNLKNPLEIYVPEFCRKIPLDFVQYVDYQGIFGKMYEVSDSFFDNDKGNNTCYCNGECLPYGAVFSGGCFQNIPYYISNPHFFNADPAYRKNVSGINPDDGQHKFQITIDPETGVPLVIKKRWQLNVFVKGDKFIDTFKTANFLYPLYWFEEISEVSKNTLYRLKLIRYIPTIFLSVGVFLVIFGIIITCFKFRFNCLKKKRNNRANA